MEPTFTEAKGLARVFKLITLATLLAVLFNFVTNFSRVFLASAGVGMPQGWFNFLLGMGTELARLATSFVIFSQFAKGVYISEGIAKCCRILSFLEFLRCFQFFQIILMTPGQLKSWPVYSHIFQSVSGTLVTASLLYCLSAAIHWAFMREKEAEEKRLLQRLNALPPDEPQK
ncbi:MAG: hypothetical protein ACO1QB_06180 [Verrucomicrobiales bacterium]